LSAELHAVADARGGFVRGGLTAGQHYDAPQALPLLDGLAPAYLIADRGYDADPLVAALADSGTLRRHPAQPEAPAPALTTRQATPIDTPWSASSAASSSSAASRHAMISWMRIF
jgi:transposase